MFLLCEKNRPTGVLAGRLRILIHQEGNLPVHRLVSGGLLAFLFGEQLTIHYARL